MKSKIAGIVFILGSLYYMIAEAISVFAFNDTVINSYLFHTISELGIPGLNSPLFYLMNSAFIAIGLTLLFANFYKFKNFIIKDKTIFYILTLITSIGVIIVALIHGGNPLTASYHSLGAVMAILGGNVLLILISRVMDKFETYQKISLILGIIGLMAFGVMFFNMGSIYMPIFERLSVYTLILWSFISGVCLLKNSSIE
ncbi:DUF998 domain-containing protein [Methanobrevibacter olleyae]|uniref:DUF998 domain-containing protein n=1 Tax=Methanobrevibacter olleyae TaxID=294671 RepID=A0A126QY05_METOL|nr:DUF998 domain-containing protein [Methanobrevibacter olleyae]AMK14726.1 hypothetical protein YLM1_0166 [Methanobrevibacter olleyae]